MSLAPASSPALSDTLLWTAQAVQAVAAGRSLTDALIQVPAGERAAAQALAFHAMRQLGLAHALRDRLLARKPPNPLLDALLVSALALLLPTRPQEAPGPSYAPHTVVDQAVRAAGSQRALTAYKGLLNAVLRRFLREQADLLAQVADLPAARWNHPAWWVDALRRAYPADWQGLLQQANQHAPMTLRVNRRRATRESVAQAMAEAGVATTPVGEAGLVLAEPRPVHALPGFAAGWWSVQDAGAQQAAELLAPRDGMRVLDACAAPGGKTAHLLELARIDLLALDVDADRLRRVGENLARLGLDADDAAGQAIRLVQADAASLDWWDGQPFDAVLADVPCTASGVVRRHPDIRWLRRAPDVARTATLQARILDNLWQTVAPGGTLVYATCSLFPQEGVLQAEAFAARHADALREAAPGQLLPLAPAGEVSLHDGFFYARFAKRR